MPIHIPKLGDEYRNNYHDEYKIAYDFDNFFHPFVGELIEKLNKESLVGMLDPKFHQELANQFGQFFAEFYETPQNSTPFRKEDKNSEQLLRVIPPTKSIDLELGGAYASYNWELLFHIPLTVAVHLSKNQRFAEAQRWFHYIFDPISNDTTVPTPQRFWKFLAFRESQKDITRIDNLLALLSRTDLKEPELALKRKLLKGYSEIRNKPFQPHAVARTRLLAYQYCVVMKYLDNLIAWGDHLFRQDTVETINEATQRYVMAANLLGERPQKTPDRGTVRPKTFAQLKAQGIDEMANALQELEGKMPFNIVLPQAQNANGDSSGPLFGIGRTLYFCIPQNDKMLGYWDTVGDRLFKVRNCMNIEGVFRQLALFDPPLDPGMLVKAGATGINIGSVTSGLNQPVGPVRCLLLIQKTLELCGEVRGLGSALLSAIEKGDGEQMALLRQAHEIKIQQMVQDVRFLQWKQAQESTESLLKSRASALERYRFYQRLLGLTPDKDAVPDKFELDRRELTEENFDEAYAALVGTYEKEIATQEYPKLKLAANASPAGSSGAAGQGSLYLNSNEFLDLNVLGPRAVLRRLDASANSVLFGILGLLPSAKAEAAPGGAGASSELSGGQVLSSVGDIISAGIEAEAMVFEKSAEYASKTASHERRADDWLLQNNQAARELVQIGRQIIGSLIAEQVALHEYESTKKQIEQSTEVDTFLHEKFTNQELYAWMQGELSRLYYEYYRFAFDTARRAEQTMKHELMRPELDAQDFVKFNYWDGGRKGLLSGEGLYLDIKRMEMAYHEHNKREYELTKHVSIRQLDPVALLTLKATGTCEVTLPEWLFDMDGPGHYMRRIKTVSLSIPSVTGPYTSVNCTLSLLKSSLRKSPESPNSYLRQGSEDPRFKDYFGTVQSIVTSTGNNDSGMFETNLRDERILPFEGAGVESTWRLELPAVYRTFDYGTISDVILHIRYTARPGVDRAKVKEALDQLFTQVDPKSNFSLLFSLRHDFPTEWSAFLSSGDLNATIRKDYFPYFTQGKQIENIVLDLYGQDVTNPENIVGVEETSDRLGYKFSAKEGKVLTRTTPNANIFLIVHYSLKGS
jgi:hypothetical protein